MNRLSLFLILTLLSACSTTRWKQVQIEKFDRAIVMSNNWTRKTNSDADDYSDQGRYFQKNNPAFKAPIAYEIHQVFGNNQWLSLELSSLNRLTDTREMVSFSDPAGAILKTAEHTDGLVLRSTEPLPPQYRVCVKMGMAQFGGSLAEDQNGYRGSEMATPWVDGPATNENGLYWLAILDTIPKPRNNVFIHHHRKAVIDSDNNDYGKDQSWTWIATHEGFVQSGVHPLMMFVLDRDHKGSVFNYDRTGQPFISYAADAWQSEAETKQIRAVDAYLDREKYQFCIAKTKTEYQLSAEGKFKYGGLKKYEAAIPISRVFEGEKTPEYFMLGDPHVNYYRGQVRISEVSLEIPRE